MGRLAFAAGTIAFLLGACVVSVTAHGSEDIYCADKKDKDRDKARREYKVRLEAEKRESQEYWNSPAAIAAAVIESVGESSIYPGYVEQKKPMSSSAGVLFAPAQKGGKPAFGIHWMGPRKMGVLAWFSGKFGRDEGVIDASIPHNDYRLEDSVCGYGLESLVGIGSTDVMLTLGAGLMVRQTMYTAVSNVTGWRWNAGSNSKVKVAGQAGLRLRIAERLSLHFGYDTAQYAFFGLSGSF